MEQPRPVSPPNERELATLPVRRIDELLPAGWTVQRAPVPARPDTGIDSALQVQAPDGRSGTLLTEAKTVVNARDVPALADRAAQRAGTGRTIVATRYLSPRTRERLTAADLSFVDWTGNLRISASDPGLMLTATGADSDPFRSPDRPTNTLRGRPAGRVVRALVDRPGPWRMRDLAAEAGTSLGSTARTVTFLDREDLITRDDRGTVTDVDWEALLRRWAEDYDLERQGRMLRFLLPRGIERAESSLRALDPTSYVASGSLAASKIAPYAETRLGVLYARDAEALAATLDARPASGTANLLVIDPADDAPFARTSQRDGLRIASLAQIAVDLLSGPGRNPEEGLALLEWMRRDEPEWRNR
jgi:hypothetical protein